MKYAVYYNKDFHHYSMVDEVLIRYYKGTDRIYDFVMENFKKQRIIINCCGVELETILPIIEKLKKDYPSQITLIIDFNTQQDDCFLLTAKNIEFYFAQHATNHELFYTMKELGASDIYVVSELAFNLKDLQKDREKVKIRVFPNIAQSIPGTTQMIPNITKFFIRPEDIEIYDKYVDVCEFYTCGENLNTIFEIYKQEQWLGPIDDIVMDLFSSVRGDQVGADFGPNRINCRQRCLWGDCRICLQIEEMADLWTENNIEIRKKRKDYSTPADKEKILKLRKNILKGTEHEFTPDERALLEMSELFEKQKSEEELMEEFKQGMKERLEENESKVDEEIVPDSGGLPSDSTGETT